MTKAMKNYIKPFSSKFRRSYGQHTRLLDTALDNNNQKKARYHSRVIDNMLKEKRPLLKTEKKNIFTQVNSEQQNYYVNGR
jgi:hypothetical protein